MVKTLSANSGSYSVSTEVEKAAIQDLKTKNSYFEQSATDLVVVHLDIIPKLLFEGMVSGSSQTVEAAVENLADIFRLSAEKRTEAYQSGGHSVIVVAMKKWMHNENIITSCCRCIQNMSCTNSAAKESFAAIGGLEAVVNAMRSFPLSQRVQRSACGALMNLLSGTDDESRLLESMSERFVKRYNGIGLIVAAMRQFPDEKKIQLWGNGLFQNLAQNKDFKVTMMQKGAVTAAGASLERHVNDANIQQYASKFMKIMFA